MEEEELDDITSNVSTEADILANKQRIIDNGKNLIDGLNGWTSEGKSFSRYGRLKKSPYFY